MRAYQRPDGSYDVYDVEPQVLTAAEYAKLKRKKELAATKERLLAELAQVDVELKELDSTTVETAAATAYAPVAPAITAEPAKRKW